MSNDLWNEEKLQSGNELGAVICRHCGELIATIPTRGVKTFYGQCTGAECHQPNMIEERAIAE